MAVKHTFAAVNSATVALAMPTVALAARGDHVMMIMDQRQLMLLRQRNRRHHRQHFVVAQKTCAAANMVTVDLVRIIVALGVLKVHVMRHQALTMFP